MNATSPKFICPRCHHGLSLKVVIEQMYGDFHLDVRDAKVEPVLRSLNARHPKMKMDGYFCSSCGQDINADALLMFDSNLPNKAGAKVGFENPDVAVNFILVSFKVRKRIMNYFVHKDNNKGMERLKAYMLKSKAKLTGEIPFKLNTRKKVLS